MERRVKGGNEAAMLAFYDTFYPLAEASGAHARFCERVYGMNLCQHGMADMAQIEVMLGVLNLGPGSRLLDLGCGTGRLTGYIQERTGCCAVGVDLSPVAIALAEKQSADRLRFMTGDMTRPEFPAASFDAITLIDTHYFTDDFKSLLDGLLRITSPGGKIAFFSDEGRGMEGADDSGLSAQETLIGRLLDAQRLPWTSHTLTGENRAHWRLKERTLLGMENEFAAEGSRFLFDARMRECTVSDRSLDCRFLFVITRPSPLVGG